MGTFAGGGRYFASQDEVPGTSGSLKQCYHIKVVLPIRDILTYKDIG